MRNPAESPDLRRLEERLESISGKLSEHTYVRIYRSLSWLRSAKENTGDDDFRLMALWISFNALYGGSDFIEGTSQDKGKLSEKRMFSKFLSDLEERNRDDLWRALVSKYESFRKNLIENKYVFKKFWADQYSAQGEEQYARHFRNDMNRARDAFASGDLGTMLGLVFDRLYVLRNQLFHGAATHGSSLNRKQVRAAGKVLEALMPVILRTVLDILRDDPQYARWGKLPYPPLDRPAAP